MGQHEIFPTEMQRGKDTVLVSTPRISKNTETISKAKYTCDEKHACTCDEKHAGTCDENTHVLAILQGKSKENEYFNGSDSLKN